MDADHVPAAAALPFSPDEIIVYGVHLNGAAPVAGVSNNIANATINVDGPWNLRLSVLDPVNPLNYAIVAAYGYAFEGQCYRLDKIKILAFFAPNATQAVGCGYDNLTDFFMWRVTSRAQVIELSSTVGEFEKVVLEANLPGRKAPNTYGSHMRLAHRSGRLTET